MHASRRQVGVSRNGAPSARVGGRLLWVLGAGSLILILSVQCFDLSSWLGYSERIPARTAFGDLIANPIPDGVSDIQGMAKVEFGGCTACLRFRAGEKFIQQFVVSRLAKVGRNEIDDMLEIGSEEGLAFWDIEQAGNLECYRSRKVHENRYSGAAEHFFAIDRDRGIVYYIGWGS